MSRIFVLLFSLFAILPSSMRAADIFSAAGTFYDLVDGEIIPLDGAVVPVPFTTTYGDEIVLSDLWGSGRDYTFKMGPADPEGYSPLHNITSRSGHNHYGHHYYLADNYQSLDLPGADSSDCLFMDYCWRYRDEDHDELCLTYWSDAAQHWRVFLVDFKKVAFPEAHTIDDLLHLPLTFLHATTVEAGGGDVLGVIYAGNGDPYAIVMAGADHDMFGSATFRDNIVLLDFLKISDLDAEVQPIASRAASRIGAFEKKGDDVVTILFATKSFVIDGEPYDEMLRQEYIFVDESPIERPFEAPTDVHAVATDAQGAAAYSLDGRRSSRYGHHRGHFCVEGGRKVLR